MRIYIGCVLWHRHVSVSCVIRYVTLKFLSNALMRCGPWVALASCWVGPILLLLLLLLLLHSLLILQVYNMPWPFAVCLLLCCAKALAFRLRFRNCFFLSFILLFQPLSLCPAIFP